MWTRNSARFIIRSHMHSPSCALSLWKSWVARLQVAIRQSEGSSASDACSGSAGNDHPSAVEEALELYAAQESRARRWVEGEWTTAAEHSVVHLERHHDGLSSAYLPLSPSAVAAIEQDVADALLQQLPDTHRFRSPTKPRNHDEKEEGEGSSSSVPSTAVNGMLWRNNLCPSIQSTQLLPSSAEKTTLPDSCAPSQVFAFRSTPSPEVSRQRHSQFYTGGSVLLKGGDLESYFAVFSTAMQQSIERSRGSVFSRADRLTTAQKSIDSVKRRLVLYASAHAFTATAEKAARLAGFQQIRRLPAVPHPKTGNLGFAFSTLKDVVREDVVNRHIPCGVCLSALGGGVGAVDELTTTAQFCQRAGMWAHLDISAPLCGPWLCRQKHREALEGKSPDVLRAAEALYSPLMREVSGALSLVDSFHMRLSSFGGVGEIWRKSRLLALADLRKLWCTSEAQRWHSVVGEAGVDMIQDDRGSTAAGLDRRALHPWYPLSSADAEDLKRESALCHQWRCSDAMDTLEDSILCLLGLLERLELHGEFEVCRQALMIGRAVFRWRLRSDEATIALCRSIQQAFESSDEMIYGASRTDHVCVVPPPSRFPVHCGLVTIQRRTWISLRFSATSRESKAAGEALWQLIERVLKQ